MRYIFIFIFIGIGSARTKQHCAYDLSSFLVIHIHEDGKTENILNLRIILVDFFGKELVNTSTKYSWTNRDEVMNFYENYKIDGKRKKLIENVTEEKVRWFFPYSKATYIISVTNEFYFEGI
jgi:hypothetical protein